MVILKFKVTGPVQGVSFRYYTQREARKLGLRGWCYNHPDESVEGLAAGSSDAINRFKVFLYRGSPAAVVDEVSLDEMADVGEAELQKMGVPASFEVRRYRR